MNEIKPLTEEELKFLYLIVPNATFLGLEVAVEQAMEDWEKDRDKMREYEAKLKKIQIYASTT